MHSTLFGENDTYLAGAGIFRGCQARLTKPKSNGRTAEHGCLGEAQMLLTSKLHLIFTHRRFLEEEVLLPYPGAQREELLLPPLSLPVQHFQMNYRQR